MKKVSLAAMPNASRRTRNRIREHPNIFMTGMESTTVMGFEGRLMLGFKEKRDGGNDYGMWLPADEILVADAAE